MTKNQPQQNDKNLPPRPTPNAKPTSQVGTMRKRNQRLLQWLNKLGRLTTSPANRAFTHGAILFFLSQSPARTQYGVELFFVEQSGGKNNGVTFCGRYHLHIIFNIRRSKLSRFKSNLFKDCTGHTFHTQSIFGNIFLLIHMRVDQNTQYFQHE